MNRDNTIKVIIADTQFLIVESLKSLLLSDDRFSVEAVVSSIAELNKALVEVKKGLLITDIALLDYNGIADLKKISFEFPEVFILILTNSISKHEFLELTKSGFKNIIYKTADKQELFTALEVTLKGKKYYSEEILDLLIEPGENKVVSELPARLTYSETEIVRLISNDRWTRSPSCRARPPRPCRTGLRCRVRTARRPETNPRRARRSPARRESR